MINDELKFYSREVFNKPRVLAANKMDLPAAKNNLLRFKKEVRKKIIPISAQESQGLEELLDAIKKKSYSRLVVKVGSSLINYRDNAIDLSRLGGLIRQINRLWDQGKEVILVSSGAVACGMSVLKLKKRPKDIPGLQAAAAIGQNELMGLYRRLLSEDGRLCAQILLTWEDFEDRERYLNVRHTISHLLKNKVLAIINENDTVSTEEIRFGDNDRLSALVANLVGQTS